ncbi:MAG: DUF4153 domain-containing protein [Gammaproteobacteria bacterium PRO9]|nr:DUF4153 domain-containing protein [Gammaproteobacteria bacterium PRO9]
MPEGLSRTVRGFIVLVALSQGLLLYLASTGQEHDWWPFNQLGGLVCWYTLVLAVPTSMTLSVWRLDDRHFWEHAVALLILYSLLSWWAAWSATGAPGLDSTAVLAPFGITVALALFILLPFLQCRLQHSGWRHSGWRAPYAELFENAWQNGLTLLLMALFVGICWAVLTLWAQLFSLVKIDFFMDLFGERPFVYLATGAMAGLGILIGRAQRRPVQVARQLLLAIFKGLLPLLSFIAVLFLISLPFTGLAPLWATRSAAAILMSLLIALVVFVNAVYQDGEGARPYPPWLRRLVEAALFLSPVYAALSLYALALRIGEYGWTDARFWAVLLAVTLAAHVCTYAYAVVRQRTTWLNPLKTINPVLALVVVVLILLANSPILDPHRITVASQMAGLREHRVANNDFDLDYLRFESGRRGYLAVAFLQNDPAVRNDAAFTARVGRVLARQQRWGLMSPEQRDRLNVKTAAGARALIQVAPGSEAPDDAWLQSLLARRREAQSCLHQGSDCILLTPDLDGDGQTERLLCDLDDTRDAVECRLWTLDPNDVWVQAGSVFLSSRSGDDPVQKALRSGSLEVRKQRWPDLEAGGAVGRIYPVE